MSPLLRKIVTPSNLCCQKDVMRRILISFLTLLCATIAIGQTQAGIEVSDLDRKADPCTDFYEYSNGAWRASNPIPSTMDRWSRRWAAGEANKDQLRVILDEASSKKDLPKGSVDQLIGDYYGACMNEARVNQAGVDPVKPMLAEIDAMKTQADLQTMIIDLQNYGFQVPFAFNASPDNHNPALVIADVGASGLGLPDRDYYFKDEPRFKQARELYLVHVANMFMLAGYSNEAAAKAARQVMQVETGLAGATLDNIARRDPESTDHKTTFAQLQQMSPHFDWTAYYADAKIPQADLNVDEPAFLAEVDK